MPVMDEYKKERESIKGKTFKEKLDYFWYYYKIHTFVAIFVLIVLIVFIRDMTTSKEYGYTCTFVNSNTISNDTEFMDEFAKTTDIDLSKYYVHLDDSTQFSTESYDQTSMAVMQKFVSMVYVGEIDNVVINRDLFANYAQNEMFLDLRTVLTEEQIGKYENHFFYVDLDNLGTEDPDYEEMFENNQGVLATDQVDRRNPEGMSNPVPVGIFLEDELNDKIVNAGFYPEDEEIVFGFLTETHLKYSQQFLDWLTEQ